MTTPPPDLLDALRAHGTLTLAYADGDGAPRACAVFYALLPEGSPVFLSSVRTRHGGRLARDGRVGFTAHADGQDWTTLTGVQGTGRCRIATGDERERADRVYRERYPFVGRAAALARALASAELWVLEPDELRLVDNRRRFGHKVEWVRGG